MCTTDLLQGNGSILPLLPEEEVIQVLKWLKNGGNKKIFVVTSLGMRVNPSLPVFIKGVLVTFHKNKKL